MRWNLKELPVFTTVMSGKRMALFACVLCIGLVLGHALSADADPAARGRGIRGARMIAPRGRSLAGRFTAPESYARLAFEEGARAIAQARPVIVK
jgi:hypothetical protein